MGHGISFWKARQSNMTSGVFGCDYDCLRTSSCTMHCMQKQTSVWFFLFGLQHIYVSLYFPLTNQELDEGRLVEGTAHELSSLLYVVFPAGICTEGLWLHHQRFWKTKLRCMHLGLVFQNIWWTADGMRQRQHQPYHSKHPQTVLWTRQTLPVVQMLCSCHSSFAPVPCNQWCRLMEFG